jgi:Fe-S-cluster containining protein
VNVPLPVLERWEPCGLCCLHMAVPPYDDEEVDLLRANLPDVHADYLAALATREAQLRVTGADSVPCFFLDPLTRRCRHHGHSPDVCHRFEPGNAYCRELRRDGGLPPLPGAPDAGAWEGGA